MKGTVASVEKHEKNSTMKLGSTLRMPSRRTHVYARPAEMPPAAPVAPAPAPMNAPAPFSMRGPDNLDYTVCRCPGQYNGVKWALVPPDMLKMALEVSAPNLYDQDREEIRRVLNQ